MKKNIIIDTDAYKLTHWKQYVDNITKLYSYGESRVGSKYSTVSFFGLQAIIAEHFLQKVTDDMINEAEEEAESAFGTKQYFNRSVWEKVRDLGYLPIKITSVPEGSEIPIDNVLFTIESTEPWFATSVNALEDLLMHVWYPTTVATRIMNIKRAIAPAFEKSSDMPKSYLDFVINDFGFRGATGFESGAIGGAAVLLHSKGSDNLPASRFIKNYYGAKGRLASVWATEHSVATSFGPGRGEFEYVLHQLRNADPTKPLSIVIDSYDSDNFVKNVLGSEEIKAAIIEFTSQGGTFVIRPDSGVPLINVCKYSDYLGAIFGFTLNSKGYKVLNNNVKIIQGDGMNETTIPELYNEYIKTGWSACNVLVGSGGGLLQVDINRDVQRFAIKASYGEKGGIPFFLQKAPKTDLSKGSKPGELKLHRMGNSYTTIQSASETPAQFKAYIDVKRVLLENGNFFPEKFEQILERAA